MRNIRVYTRIWISDTVSVHLDGDVAVFEHMIGVDDDIDDLEWAEKDTYLCDRADWRIYSETFDYPPQREHEDLT